MREMMALFASFLDKYISAAAEAFVCGFSNG
jgi:hypothetical protein